MPGTWTPLVHQPPFGAGTMLLLTDGTVMCQSSNTANWWKLTPDSNGSYVNGTWSPIASAPWSQLYFVSAVLRDGRVFVAGGEYSNAGSDAFVAAIYNPTTNGWTSLLLNGLTSLGWSHIGDAASCVLPDGRVMIGNILDGRCAIYDPVANSWTAAGTALNDTNEETWTLLPDQTILTCDCFGYPGTEKYLIAADKWISTGNTPVNLVDAGLHEIGPALLLPDGRLFAVGATGATALYTMPPVASQPGTWANGPAFPNVGGQLGATDAPACLLPNGNVLCAVGHGFNQGLYFYEYDPVANTLTAAPGTPGSNTIIPYNTRMLLLPTGQVLLANGTNDVEVYNPTGGPDPAWRPQITGVASYLVRGSSNVLYGRQINGLSQAVSYGDDAQMATNYPLVRITSGGHVYYCRTFNHSTLGVNTGTVIHSTHFTIPSSVPSGSATLTVVANGIPSVAVNVTIGTKVKEIDKSPKELKDFEIGLNAAGQPTLEGEATLSGNDEATQQPFITEEERPDTGGAARTYPPSRAKRS